MCKSVTSVALPVAWIYYDYRNLNKKVTLMKNSIFQYGTNQRMLVDTDLISIDDANLLFAKNRDDFSERLVNGENPEMCVWINCKNNQDYNESSSRWVADDMKVIDGELWQRV